MNPSHIRQRLWSNYWIAIPLLDTLLTQMNEMFSSEYIHGLLGLIPSVIVSDEGPSLANLLH